MLDKLQPITHSNENNTNKHNEEIKELSKRKSKGTNNGHRSGTLKIRMTIWELPSKDTIRKRWCKWYTKKGIEIAWPNNSRKGALQKGRVLIRMLFVYFGCLKARSDLEFSDRSWYPFFPILIEFCSVFLLFDWAEMRSITSGYATLHFAAEAPIDT